MKLPEPFLTSADAERLANLIAEFPAPEKIGDEPPSADFREGFDEAKRVAVMLIVAMGRECDSSFGCAPVASR